MISVSTIGSNFLIIDDYMLIVNNPQLKLSSSNLISIFSKPLAQIYDADYYPNLARFVYYRPVLICFYLFNAVIWGLNPVGFHITNLLLHLMTTFMVYRTGLLLFDSNREVSLLAAAFFCVHPVHNELIGRVAMNENLLGFLMVISFYFYLQERKIISLVAFSLALLTKESAVMLPFVLLIFELSKKNIRAVADCLAPYLALVVSYLGVRALIVHFPDSMMFSENWSVLFLKSCSAMATYFRLLLIPYPLSIFYPVRKFGSVVQWDIFWSFAVVSALGCLLWKLRSERTLRSLLIGTAILLMPVVVNANNLIVGLDRAFIAERQLYVPAILFSLFIAALIYKYKDLLSGQITMYALLIIIPIYMFLLINVSTVWRYDHSVTARFVKHFPATFLARMTRGHDLLKNGKLDAALVEFESLLPVSKNGAMDKVFNANDWNNALAPYQAQFADIHFGIGQVYAAKNDLETAMRKFRVAILLQPHFDEAHIALARAYLKKGLFKEASQEFRLAR